jgi:predicted ATP-grasp superfamily ATP-dependent carboligase
LNGTGGHGIVPYQPDRRVPGDYYFQEFIDGIACAASYVADGQKSWLLGVTRQLVGETWLRARAFQYCGSVGPLHLATSVVSDLQRLGQVLVQGTGLRGVFGIDFILRDNKPWLTEVNPRYTASMEVLEYALLISFLALHRSIFEPPMEMPAAEHGSSNALIGKAILFARQDFLFPAEGPWMQALQEPGAIEEPPSCADIPSAGQEIRKGQPILTVIVRANSESLCLNELQAKSQDLDRWLTCR